jgi:hypothetical protein
MKPSWIRFPAQSVWQKASFCQTGECAEVAKKDDVVLMRNSTNPRCVVSYSNAEWDAFVQGIKAGEFDDLG